MLLFLLFSLLLGVNAQGDDAISFERRGTDVRLLGGLLVSIPLPGLHDLQRRFLLLSIFLACESDGPGLIATPRRRRLRGLCCR